MSGWLSLVLLVSLVLLDGGLNLRLAGCDLQHTVLQLVTTRGLLGLGAGDLLGMSSRDCPGT